MTKRHILITIFILLTLSTLAAYGGTREPGTVAETPQTQFLTPPTDIRNYRYCEIIPVFRSGVTFYVEVYNTIGLNQCPADQWQALDEDTLAEAYDAVAVKLNGPRYWVLNEITGAGKTAEGKTADFGGIEMNLRAVLETKLWEGTVGDKLYTDNEVQRTTTFTYYAGNMVYELTSPQGDVYRMQSYSQIIDPTLTIDDLATLENRLNLPAGWHYQARLLTTDSKLIADGVAYVINDDLANSYQKVTP